MIELILPVYTGKLRPSEGSCRVGQHRPQVQLLRAGKACPRRRPLGVGHDPLWTSVSSSVNREAWAASAGPALAPWDIPFFV